MSEVSFHSPESELMFVASTIVCVGLLLILGKVLIFIFVLIFERRIGNVVRVSFCKPCPTLDSSFASGIARARGCPYAFQRH